MGGRKSFALWCAALAAAAATLSPANAQCRLCDKPTTTPDQPDGTQPIQLEVETSLDFDRLILFGDSDGAAVIRPDGSNAAEGSVTAISPRAMVGTAVVHGQPGRAVRVELPLRMELYSVNGGRITFDNIASDLPTVPRLDSAGSLTFRFGGRVRIAGDADGDYRGDMPITVEYQ
jgi:hypothetical protein